MIVALAIMCKIITASERSTKGKAASIGKNRIDCICVNYDLVKTLELARAPILFSTRLDITIRRLPICGSTSRRQQKNVASHAQCLPCVLVWRASFSSAQLKRLVIPSPSETRSRELILNCLRNTCLVRLQYDRTICTAGNSVWPHMRTIPFVELSRANSMELRYRHDNRSFASSPIRLSWIANCLQLLGRLLDGYWLLCSSARTADLHTPRHHLQSPSYGSE